MTNSNTHRFVIQGKALNIIDRKEDIKVGRIYSSSFSMDLNQEREVNVFKFRDYCDLVGGKEFVRVRL